MTSTTTPRIACCLVIGSLFALVGCGNHDEEVAIASVQSALQSSKSANSNSTVQPRKPEACLDPAAAAEDAAGRPSVGLYPSSCVSKNAEGAAMHVELDDCTGPFGKVHLFGGLDATFTSASCDKLHAEVADSGDLTGNDRPVDYSASADITVDGDKRNVDWAGHWSVTTERGIDVEHTSDLTIVADATTNCLTVDGTGHGTASKWEFSTQISGLAVCPDTCPSAGKLGIQVDGPRGDRSLSVEFDGSAKAKVTGTDGDVFEVDMVCDG